MFRNALVSVSDKTGLIDFIKSFPGMRVVSTGGTAQHLKAAGISVVDVSEQTQFPEILDGRVKTLHPKIHMGLLANLKLEEHLKILNQYEILPFDLVVVNLYPFTEALLRGAPDHEMIENIDVGGPSMIRAACKNFQSVTVICDSEDYEWIRAKTLKNHLCEEDRRKLASKAFARLSSYDQAISKYLSSDLKRHVCEESHKLHKEKTHKETHEEAHGDHSQVLKIESESKWFTESGKRVQELRYGENPQQKASWFQHEGSNWGWHQAQIIQGKELSYNNLLDLEAARNLVAQFDDSSVVAVKHNNPCGVATDRDSYKALRKAMQSDPVSVFGGILAVNFLVTHEHASFLNEIFLECIIAPEVTEEAKEIFKKKKNLRILEWKNWNSEKSTYEIRSIAGGFLKQSQDIVSGDTSKWKIHGGTLTKNQIRDFIFGEKVCASLKSNSIAIVYENQTLGLGMGQVNRIDAVQQAISRWKTHHPQIREPSLVSDAFFPFRDSIDLIYQSGIKLILQPGGSLKDEEVLRAASEHEMIMVMTGERHFRH